MTDEEKRLKRNAYYREYYRNHREEVLAKRRAYYNTESGRAAVLKANKRYCEAHREHIREIYRKANANYYQKVKSDPVLLEQMREKHRQYYHKRKEVEKSEQHSQVPGLYDP
ncbi:MAG: hypothetical protein MJZ81_07765 [Bacteroidales bacterium]|nr:hypothetical protein [Bacteroidales bacterium]